MNKEDATTTIENAKKQSFRKLFPLIIVAEVGLSAFFFCYLGTVGTLMLLPAIPSVAAIIFTVLRALKIKPKFTETAAMICVSLSVFLFLMVLAGTNLSAISQRKNLMANIPSEETEIAELEAQLIREYAIMGSAPLVFAVLMLPISVYLPIWNLRRKRSNEEALA